MGYDNDSIAELIRFIYASGHLALTVLGMILGWQK